LLLNQLWGFIFRGKDVNVVKRNGEIMSNRRHRLPDILYKAQIRDRAIVTVKQTVEECERVLADPNSSHELKRLVQSQLRDLLKTHGSTAFGYRKHLRLSKLQR